MSRRGHGEAEHDTSERWLLTYADMITLLVAFFIILYSAARIDVDKFARLRTSMQRAFNPGGVMESGETMSLAAAEGSGLLPGDEAGLMEAIARQVAMPENVEALGENLKREGIVRRDAEELNQIACSINAEPSGGDGGVFVHRNREGVVVSIWGGVLFDSGRAVIKESSVPVLQRIGAVLVQMTNELRVEGHTDNIPISTSLYPSNWELSTARATTVARYLISAGKEERKIAVVGYGEFRPLANNDTRENRAHNRRVDIVIIYPEAPLLLPDFGDLQGATVGGNR